TELSNSESEEESANEITETSAHTIIQEKDNTPIAQSYLPTPDPTIEYSASPSTSSESEYYTPPPGKEEVIGPVTGPERYLNFSGAYKLSSSFSSPGDGGEMLHYGGGRAGSNAAAIRRRSNNAPRSTEISGRLDVDYIIPEGVKRQRIRKQYYNSHVNIAIYTVSAFHTAFSAHVNTNQYYKVEVSKPTPQTSEPTQSKPTPQTSEPAQSKLTPQTSEPAQ
ncbi:MAG: hypothetical protein Q9214_007742, partial [Letrouitia sp. 1 TL-2023]